MSEYLRIDDQAAHGRALALARGSFQRDLLARMTEDGIRWHEERGPCRRRVLVIGS